MTPLILETAAKFVIIVFYLKFVYNCALSFDPYFSSGINFSLLFFIYSSATTGIEKIPSFLKYLNAVKQK